MEMTVEQLESGIVKAVLNGRLDIAGAAEIDMRFSVMAGANRAVIVDMAGVPFLASIGIRTLLIGAKAIQRRGGKMVLLRPTAEVEKVLWVSGVADLMPIFHADAEALAAVAA